MIKNSKKVKKVVCLFLIMCLTVSMIFTTSINSAQALGGSATPLQNVILQALSLGDTGGEQARKDFVSNVLDKSGTLTEAQLIAAVKPYFTMNDSDVVAGINAYKKLNDLQKAAVGLVIKSGFSVSAAEDTSAFKDIVEKINQMVTGNKADNKGFRFTVTLMDKIAEYDSEPVAFNLNGQAGQIQFAYNGAFKASLDGLFANVDNFPNESIKDVDTFLSEAQKALNDLNKASQIVAFKNFLEGKVNPKIYVSNTMLQKVILQAFNLENNRTEFVTNVLEKTFERESQRIAAVKTYFTKMNDADIEEGLDAYDALSASMKLFVNEAIKAGYTVDKNVDVSAFKDVAEKINNMVTGNYFDKSGFRFTVTLIEQLAVLQNKAVVYDLDGKKEKISFACENVYKDLLDPLFQYMESKPAAISSVDTFFTAAQNALNNLGKDDQIKAFKNYLKGENEKIYNYTPPTVPPTTVPPTVPPTVAPTSSTSSNPSTNPSTNPSSAATPTSTVTSTATQKPTPTTTPATKPSDKQITSFSFKGLTPEAKGVIFERLRTIIVKVPLGTNLKNLVPSIEYKGASIKPESGTKKNFSHPVFYTVTAQDKSKARYVVVVIYGTNNVVEEPQEIRPGAGPYGDVIGHWAEDNLIGLIECGVMTGYPDLSIKPNNDMTRAEVVTMIAKALGLNPDKNPKLKFKDTKSIPSWAEGYLKVALDKGFIQGYPDNTIRPMEKVTRAEFSVMVMKAYGFDVSKAADLKFKDARDVIPDWAKKYVSKAVELKIINGYDDNTFKPSNFITRAEVGAIIDRCFTASGKNYPEL